MKRNETIDIARGIAIILMCVGHAYCPDILCRFIYMFHMAFFFITSGYFFNKEKSISCPRNFIIKRIKGLYLPFIKWGIAFTLLHNLFLNLKLLTPQNHYYDIKETLWKAFTTNTRFIPTEEFMGPYWFFSCLFYVSIFSLLLFVISSKLLKKQWTEWALFVIVYAIGFILLYTRNGENYSIFIRTCVVSFLFYLGYLWSKNNDKIPYNWMGLIASMIILIAGLLSPYSGIGIPELNFQNPILFLIYSLSGTYMLLCASKYIDRYTPLLKRFLSYTGSKTLIILLTNILCLRICHIIRSYIEGYDGYPTTIPQSETAWYWWILYSIFMVIVPLSVTWSITYIKNKIKINQL